MVTDFDLVRTEVRDGWGTLTLERSEKRNAISAQLADDFVGALSRLEQSCHVVLLRATGPVFCAGADVSDGVSFDDDRPTNRVVRALVDTPAFVIAVVGAPVFGAGISMLRACPVVLATTEASFGLPERRLGMFPLGVVPYLESAVPRRRLIQLGMEAGALAAEEAHRLGLVTEVVEPGDLRASVDRWLDRTLENPTAARQAAWYWREALRAPEFAARVERLERVLAGDIPEVDRPGGRS